MGGARRFRLPSYFCCLVLTLAIVSTTASFAVDFSNVDLRPLLHVHSTKVSKTLPEFPPQKEIFDDEDLFITQGGATISVIFIRPEGGDYGSELIRVVSPAQPLGVLTQELAADRIGFQTNCELATQGTVTGRYDISWYGKKGRSNSFTIALASGGTSGLPSCPPQMDALTKAITEYESHVVGGPGSEIFHTP